MQQFDSNPKAGIFGSSPSVNPMSEREPSAQRTTTFSVVSVTPPPITTLDTKDREDSKDSDGSSDEQEKVFVSVDQQRSHCKELILAMLSQSTLTLASAEAGAPVEGKGKSQAVMLPWLTMSKHLSDAGLIITGWPPGVPFPGEATAKTAQQKQAQGIKTPSTKETRTLLTALQGGKVAKPSIKKAPDLQRVLQSLDPVIIGAKPMLGSAYKYRQYFYLDGVV
ncbi:hypothetical protein LshimejAT787_3100020 [Lyophyllum shimeji]|uniref:Uncharacterized protein n=1 Tax=Lyophyllum shimeji TaxID=47721 RepID=A0A9P3Q2V4_LYOSH|nr:hypothetical protein LshimejAT787_3100020 [Lyophyllum shimeji]